MKKLLLLAIGLMFIASLMPAQTFVGSDACKNCHSEKYNIWVESGHPYKFTATPNGPPEYPNYVTNYSEQWLDSLGDGSHDWTEIAGVIGGWGWKTRFVGADGIIIGTASSSYPDAGIGHNQHNFFGGEDHGWVNYNASTENKYYNYSCFKCHTTGGDTSGTWLAPVADLGSFTEEGIGCESCHGPGSDHVSSGGDKTKIDLVYEFAHQDNASGGLTIGDDVMLPDPDRDDINFLCGTCHNRGYASPIDASGGFVRHHEQWDEMVATKHFGERGLNCNTCHEPHTRVIWDGDGIIMNCVSCHQTQAEIINHPGNATCVDCHMPYAAKSGTKRGQSGYVGDVRSHLMKIIPDTNSMFTEDGKWVKDDDDREAALSPAYSCLGCHNNDPDDDIPDKTLAQAAAGAMDMHEATFITTQKDLVLGVYPNPASGPMKITFSLMTSEEVSINIYNTSGQVVYRMTDVNKPAGGQTITWDRISNTGIEVPAGYYLVKVKAGTLTSVQKVILMD